MLGFGKARKDAPKEPARPASAPPSAEPEVAPPEAELDATLEALGGVLRVLGRNAFAMEDATLDAIGRKFEAWAQHVLVLSPTPDRPAEPTSERAEVRRDWVGLRRFLLDHRKREVAYVQESVEGLRDAVWAFVRSLNRVLGHERSADVDVAAHLKRLREATEKRSTEELKREVLATVGAIETVMVERRRKQLGQTEELGKRIRSLGEQLAAPARDGALDALTKLSTRKAFDAFVAGIADLGGVFHQPATLLMIDVDHFKKINETFGHPTGDEVLRGVADLVARTFLRRGDFVARYGGEEFAVVLSDVPLAASRPLVERHRAALKTLCFQRGGRVFGVTVSIGAAELQPGEAPESWVERADAAMRSAKHHGRNRVVEAT